jgi:nitric oxide reductase large subunit
MKNIFLNKILIVFFILFFVMSSISNVYARPPVGVTPAGSNFSTNFPTETEVLNEKAISVMGMVIRIIQIIAVGIAIIMLTYIGIKYITESPKEKAELRKTLMQYFIGAILLFCSSAILEFIQNVAKGIK